MTIRPTATADIPDLLALFGEARITIAALGIDQWQNGYPGEDVIRDDIQKGRGFVIRGDNGAIVATFALISDGEPTYDRIFEGAWLTGDHPTALFTDKATDGYLAIHRVAIALSARGRGIAGRIMAFAAETAAERGLNSLRIDTHAGNIVMRKMLEKQGFVHCGRIVLESGDDRVAYEKQLL